MKYYKVDEKTLLKLLVSKHRLSALDQDGVDNWSWYGEGFNEYIANHLNCSVDEVKEKDLCFRECAEKDLENFYGAEYE